MYPFLFQKKFIATEGANRPQRIVSLVPSQTELLASLGLYERVVGITKYCVHPANWLGEKVVVGGTKKIDIEKIKTLQPDLIIANKEENVKEQIAELAAFCPVYVSDVYNLNTALEMILQVGLLVGSLMQAESLVHEIVLAFEELEKQVAAGKIAPKVAYLIWRKPYMVAGGDTFISDMLQRCGLVNVFTEAERYPEITIDVLQEKVPDILLLSSEPFPFSQKHIEELQPLLPGSKILLVDGEMFSWYGSRLLKAVAYFQTLGNQLQL